MALVASVLLSAALWVTAIRTHPSARSVRTAALVGLRPVYAHDFPDPSVLVVGSRYFAYSTQSGSFNIPVITSSDLVHFTAPHDALPVLPSWARAGYTWAPAVAADPSGGYELFFAARDTRLGIQCIGRAVSIRPSGPFVDTAAEPFLCQTSLGGSIDPYVLSDDGATYLIWKSDGANGTAQQIWSQRLGPDDDSLVGVPSLLLSATSTWEHGVVEGPAMLQTTTGLYLYFSGNRWTTSAYSIGAVGCDSPLGPCANGPDDRNDQEVSTLSSVSGPGGPTFFTTPDGIEMMAYAAWSGTPGSTGARELYLDEVDTSGTFPTLIQVYRPAH